MSYSVDDKEVRDGGAKLMPKSLWAHEPILTPERKLWRAVLEQACLDSELPPSLDGSLSDDCAQARRYLRAESRFEQANLELVCDFADVPADRVVLWSRKRYPLAA
ncbi:MAG: hypothetical protein DMG43_07810 [Acidobacteria bacterium]|nr:MAG: hypothetical protein DMG43_07810 [Acidobacteriota bacterium]